MGSDFTSLSLSLLIFKRGERGEIHPPLWEVEITYLHSILVPSFKNFPCVSTGDWRYSGQQNRSGHYFCEGCSVAMKRRGHGGLRGCGTLRRGLCPRLSMVQGWLLDTRHQRFEGKLFFFLHSATCSNQNIYIIPGLLSLSDLLYSISMNAASVPLPWASQHLLLASSRALPCRSPGFLGVSFENCHSGGTWLTQKNLRLLIL